MVLFTFAKQLGRAIIRRKAYTPFMKPSSLGFNLYKAFSSAPVSALRQFSTSGEGTKDQSSGESFEPRTPQPAFNNPDTDVFMGGIDWAAQEKEIKEFFTGLGEITIRIPKNPEGRSRGFAFVRFSSAEFAKKALENNGKMLLGRPIKLAPAGEKPVTKNNKLFVANISNSVNQETLTQHFSQYGNVVSTKIVNDSEGNPRGFGFIEFENSEDALKALKSSGVELDGRALVVNISLPGQELPVVATIMEPEEKAMKQEDRKGLMMTLKKEAEEEDMEEEMIVKEAEEEDMEEEMIMRKVEEEDMMAEEQEENIKLTIESN
eukprot:CAMPEP_0202945250 /NCGR_PEP_ID=MMETSP1395-20130829/6224_1 /ASSEMBLY_ACC=CAM_ASM_000871 /TAXON_ID=5961 /ORGANISM="Blepharisma japonicum, Strain Stock R1072" /LENGTH=319 /DNA_ID=CAMNT_0049645029 /DNA_START=25 /DNA_END=985 /DNA_ORIENTATION=+